MGEEKGEIQVRAMTAIGWRDLRGIWAGPSMIEGIKLGYAFREGNTWTPT